MSDVLLSASGISVGYPASRGRILQAVDDVSFDVHRGTCLALVGESGCGKSSLARAILQLMDVQSGSALLHQSNGKPLDLIRPRMGQRRAGRRLVQCVFQDPLASLNPRFTVEATIAEPLRNFSLVRRRDLQDKVVQLLDQVGLDAHHKNRYPHELSGGQRQRVGIARALAAEPELLILDEAVSALDVSLRAQILNLLWELRRQQDLTMIFITHDLSVVQSLADRVAVMYLGHLVEIGPASTVMKAPLHPYTRALMSAIPVPHPRLRAHRLPNTLPGDPPSPLNLPRGCPFEARCPIAVDSCKEGRPPLNEGHHRTACPVVTSQADGAA